MRALARLIDRFCYKRPRFGIPNLIRYIVFGTALVYLFGLMDTTNTLHALLSFSPTDILRGQIWRLISFSFISTHINPIFLFITLYLSFFLGTSLEHSWGTAKFTVYYLLSVTLLAATGMFMYLLPIPASAAAGFFVSGYSVHTFLIMAFATLYPNTPFRLFFIIPVPAKWIGIASAASLIYLMVRAWIIFPVNLIPLVLFFIYFLFAWDFWSHLLGLRRKQHSGAAINFKRASKKIRKARENRPYTRKCAVCGKTDADHPDMEFRYCSRCNGYHCFCMEHINNHVH